MQKDYLRRKGKEKARQEELHSNGHSEPNSPKGSTPRTHHYLPSRSATLGSVKDNSGGEVIGERVILYIHGACYNNHIDLRRF